MDAEKIINAAAIGVSALLEVIGHVKQTNQLTDEQIAAQLTLHTTATKDAIQGYLAKL